MKLILHVGPPKTGTTALQRALFGSRESLLDQSVLYPDPAQGKEYNHGSLCSLFLPYAEAPRGIKQVSEVDYNAKGQFLAQQIKKQNDEQRPDILILSSEWFARAHNTPDAHKLIAFAESLGPTKIEILLYARRPSDFFLSASQQRLRACSQFKPIFDWNVNGLIDGLKALAPQHVVTVRTFDRAFLDGGSIITDFARHYTPAYEGTLNQAQTSRDNNESFSAEAMVILQDFRRTRFGDQEDIFNKYTSRVMRRLQKFDAIDRCARPKLKPDWKAYLDYGNAQALLLRDKHGVTFSNFDYARLERADFEPEPEKSEDVASFVSVQLERLERMINYLESSFWSPTRASAYWLHDLSVRSGCTRHHRRPIWRSIY